MGRSVLCHYMRMGNCENTLGATTPTPQLGAGFLGLGSEGDETVVVIVVAVIVRQAAVARYDVEDDLAAFEIETEFEFTQTRVAHCFA